RLTFSEVEQGDDPAQERETNRGRIAALSAALKYNPADSRMHARLALVLRDLFDQMQSTSENAIGLELVRDAAIASQFPTHAKLHEWLDRAVGKQRKVLLAA